MVETAVILSGVATHKLLFNRPIRFVNRKKLSQFAL